MTPIERVARAICEAERMNPDDPLGGWKHWTEPARAAIDASLQIGAEKLESVHCNKVYQQAMRKGAKMLRAMKY